MANELRNKIYNIQTNLTNPEIFENMLIHSTFKFNQTSIIVWLTLAFTSTLYLMLFIISFTLYIKQRKTTPTIANNQNHDLKHLYEPIQMQPVPIQNQSLLQELGNVIIQHHTTHHNPTQIRLNP
jgi:hypothetical protein